MDTFIAAICSYSAKLWVCACKSIVHASLCVWVILCAQTCSVCSPKSIHTFISFIRPNLAEVWVQAHIVLMHDILCAWITLCMQTWPAQTSQSWPACPPYSLDTSISPIQSNLPKLLSFLILWQSEDRWKFNKEYTTSVYI